MLEKQIEKKVCDYAKSFGFQVYKFTSPGMRAVPDRLFVYKGKIFFIEFKRGGCKVTGPQEREHTRLREAGATVFVVDDVSRGKFIIDMVERGADLKGIVV